VAEQVDKLAEDVADHLPPGGKLKEAAALIEHLAEETAKGAHLVDKAIEQVWPNTFILLYFILIALSFILFISYFMNQYYVRW
jgi:hypothetical protein